MKPPPPLRAESTGQPLAVSSLARLLLRLHAQQQRPALKLVTSTPKETTPTR